MNRSLVPALLSISALMLWADRLAFMPEPRSPSLAPFAETAKALWPGAELRSEPFENNRLIPDKHLHLMAKTPEYENQLFSVYIGHYPLLADAGDSKPHDPILCYKNSGYEIIEAPQLLHFDQEGQQLAVKRMVVGSRSENGGRYEFTTFFWSQFAGRMPEANADLPNSLTRTQLRYSQRRADLAWVRIEFTGAKQGLNEDLQKQLLRLMHSAKDLMRDE
ncbi:MAG: hypothetical protein CSA62_02770 [Planctomycetota bacterium]|nr:MAG: hypothetical protein CSA62_02770 [Planctomycetota bacterium]